MRSEILILVCTFFLAGCTIAPIAPTLTEQQYKAQLGAAVCAAIQTLNAAGSLGDAKKLSSEFEKSLQMAMVKLGYDVDEMLQAKTEYFTPEEHEKILKLHFTWCLINDSLTDDPQS